MKKDELTGAELERLMALESEVKGELAAKAEAQRAAEEAARKQRAKQAALEARKAQLAAKKTKTDQALTVRESDDVAEADEPGFFDRLRGKAKTAEAVSDAMSIAANAKRELEKPREKGEKSLLWSGGLSFVLGPLGWLYAGAWREAIPAAFAYLLVASIATKLPIFLIWPVLMVALPISGVAGLVYAWQYNRNGHRTRLFGEDDDNDDEPKKLKK